MKIAVLASGGGTNFQSIIDNIESGYIPDSQIAALLTNKPDAGAIERAKKHGIKVEIIEPGEDQSREDYDTQ